MRREGREAIHAGCRDAAQIAEAGVSVSGHFGWPKSLSGSVSVEANLRSDEKVDRLRRGRALGADGWTPFGRVGGRAFGADG